MEVTPTPTTNPTGTDAFVQELQNKLMATGDMISSANSGLDQKINEAISNVTKANESSKSAINSNYDRQISLQNEKDQNAITATRERGVGVSTDSVAYKALAKEADTNLKDLEQRKNELILQGDATAAAKVADLQIQTLDFKTKAMQQTFTNLLSLGNFGLQTAQNAREQQTLDFNQKSTIKTLGLQYGITPSANDTLDTISVKVGAVAGQKAALEIQQLKANINKANAEATKAMREGKVDLANPTQLDGLINIALTDPNGWKNGLLTLIANGKNAQAGQLSEVTTKAGIKQAEQVTSEAKGLIDQGYTLDEAWSKVGSSQTWLNPDEAHTKFVEAYNKAKAEKKDSKSILDYFSWGSNPTLLNNAATPTASKAIPGTLINGGTVSNPLNNFDPSQLFKNLTQ